MNKWALMLVVLVSAYLVGLLSSRPKAPAPTVATGFLGFTNAGARQEALFAVSNPPIAVLNLHSVRRLSRGGTNASVGEAGRFSWMRREPWGLPYAITVDTTNEPLQVVFKFQKRSVGPRRIVEYILEEFGRMTGNEREFFTGSTFFVTNETRTASLPR